MQIRRLKAAAREPQKCLRTLLWLSRNGNFCLFGGALLASQPAEIRGNILSKAKIRGTAHVAAADCHQRASPSDTSQELVF